MIFTNLNIFKYKGKTPDYFYFYESGISRAIHSAWHAENRQA